VADLNTSNSKASSLLYLREDRIKISLNNFFEANRIFEKEIFNNLDDEQLGMADIRCLLIINLNPGIIFNELLNILDIRKQSLNRVLRSLLKEKFIIQKINADDGRKKNLYLTDTAKDKLNNVIKPLIDRLSKSYVKSGANAVQGFNMVVNSLIEKNNE
jgi:DNA-binding MarR family transcriptional regulator|tara:strand:+ start:743 stop:1219 length:477 start_codon:yes stop_codon:yes gene_type:complete